MAWVRRWAFPVLLWSCALICLEPTGASTGALPTCEYLDEYYTSNECSAPDWCARAWARGDDQAPPDAGAAGPVRVSAYYTPVDWGSLAQMSRHEQALNESMRPAAAAAAAAFADGNEWVVPAVSGPREYDAAFFCPLLPTGGVRRGTPEAPGASVGDVWDATGAATDAFMCLLSQLHVRPSPGRHEPHGVRATLVEVRDSDDAKSAPGRVEGVAAAPPRWPRWLRVAFRVHAEFLLDTSTLFFLTPAQFAGEVVIREDCGAVRGFHMEVPHRALNADAEWIVATPDVESRTGRRLVRPQYKILHIPRMELSTFPAGPQGPLRTPGRAQNGREDRDAARVVVDYAGLAAPRTTAEGAEGVRRGIDGYVAERGIGARVDWGRGWTRRWPPVATRGGAADWVAADPVAQRLLASFYPFQRGLTYHPPLAALTRARKAGRLVHAVVLWGALDDQSC